MRGLEEKEKKLKLWKKPGGRMARTAQKARR
jgi:hypothetical protein